MLTTWQQIEEWIRDNQFDHWIFSRNKFGDEGEKFTKMIDSDYYAGDFEDKLQMTHKYLEMNGGHSYGYGYKKGAGAKGSTMVEVNIIETYQPQVSGMPVASAPVDENRLRESIKRELQAEWDKKEYDRKRAELDKERKEFEKEKDSAIGALVHYFAPIGKQILGLGGNNRMVAGLDADAPVEAAPIVPAPKDEPDTQDPQEASPFTDEEADELFALMARFKKAEPQYLPIIRKVVAMAESGDENYTFARKMLLV